MIAAAGIDQNTASAHADEGHLGNRQRGSDHEAADQADDQYGIKRIHSIILPMTPSNSIANWTSRVQQTSSSTPMRSCVSAWPQLRNGSNRPYSRHDATARTAPVWHMSERAGAPQRLQGDAVRRVACRRPGDAIPGVPGSGLSANDG